jgi:hypothetical protein
MLSTREDPFIKLFISAYEDGSWADADLKKPDAIDRKNPAVDQLATRKSDSRTLAVEHTIIEPFVGDKGDFASFEAAFLDIEKDKSLVVHGRWLEVFVPAGALQKQPPAARNAMVQSVQAWIKSNRLTLPEGRGTHTCPITGIPGNPSFDITLNVRVTPLKRGSADEPGALHVRRQQVDVNLGQVIEKALKKKVPKLVNTKADKRILLLERQHSWMVSPYTPILSPIGANCKRSLFLRQRNFQTLPGFSRELLKLNMCLNQDRAMGCASWDGRHRSPRDRDRCLRPAGRGVPRGPPHPKPLPP